MLAADGSEHSKRAAKKAAEIASVDVEATLTIVYVVDPDETKHEVMQNWNNLDLKSKRKERIQVIVAIIEKTGVQYSVMMLNGKPGPTIVDYANKHHFDLVVIGSRGLNSLQEFVLGSVSHKVAKRVNCPVLIVK